MGVRCGLVLVIAAIYWVVVTCVVTNWHTSRVAENTSSVALAERLGPSSLRQANVPVTYQSIGVDVWGQSREEWLARRAQAGFKV